MRLPAIFAPYMRMHARRSRLVRVALASLMLVVGTGLHGASASPRPAGGEQLLAGLTSHEAALVRTTARPRHHAGAFSQSGVLPATIALAEPTWAEALAADAVPPHARHHRPQRRARAPPR